MTHSGVDLPLSIDQSVDRLRTSLREYIEATYNIGEPGLIRQREALLNRRETISQDAFIESTPRYTTGQPFADLGMPSGVTTVFSELSKSNDKASKILHDPPYSHQFRALQSIYLDGMSQVIATGTGSGKTESFLMPTLAKLLEEGILRPDSFKSPAVRVMVLYPMNALVNDQLARMRLLFSDERVTSSLKAAGSRPIRFARYTSRTPYAGVRTNKKDGKRLKPIAEYYANLESDASRTGLLTALKARGKWPAKPNFKKWFGSGAYFRNNEFVRAVTLLEDSELFTRHEVLVNPADILITNYSMLEYMLMRPIESPIFEQTSAWLQKNPDEKFLLIVDEAHLYRGGPGAEVGLLIRRLRTRLGIPENRFQVVCTSASFNDSEVAKQFGADLGGIPVSQFADTILGQLDVYSDERAATEDEASQFSAMDIHAFYLAQDDDERRSSLGPVEKLLGLSSSGDLASDLFEKLRNFGPLRLLINLTMKEAVEVRNLEQQIFPHTSSEISASALSSVIALATFARKDADSAGLLPCRVHTFFRGLSGLWACVNTNQEHRHPIHSDVTLPDDMKSGNIARLFTQPQSHCDCGGRVYEYFTCRYCGSSYIRGYVNDLETPNYVWAEESRNISFDDGQPTSTFPIDLLPLGEELLGQVDGIDTQYFDFVTGRLRSTPHPTNTVIVGLREDRSPQKKGKNALGATGFANDDGTASRFVGAGEFFPCGVCGESAPYGTSSVQDHQTKGDQPFHAVVSEQLGIQPPSKAFDEFAPLQGRKVLTFADSRQVAARLAPALQTYTTRNQIRALLVVGYQFLQANSPHPERISLQDSYAAILLGANLLNVNIRVEIGTNEEFVPYAKVRNICTQNEHDHKNLADKIIYEIGQMKMPISLLRVVTDLYTDKYAGLEALAVASLVIVPEKMDEIIQVLPDLDGVNTPELKKLVLDVWISGVQQKGLLFAETPADWHDNGEKGGPKSHDGSITAVYSPHFLGLTSNKAKKSFKDSWVPVLRRELCKNFENISYFDPKKISLSFETNWVACKVCRKVDRPNAVINKCRGCGSPNVSSLDPSSDVIFRARKAYYRGPIEKALQFGWGPLGIRAAEHTAQLNAANNTDVYSRAELYELLFQDVNIGTMPEGQTASAIDVLSCTTTMEVGIDIGSLSGVALRNMPPNRASYQQRAGRAGRRGNSLATVVAVAGADSHDDHFFSNPAAMIKGELIDPVLSLDNGRIARRHVNAYVLQRYLHEKLADIAPENNPQLFEVLGTVEGFAGGMGQEQNIDDLEVWLQNNGQIRNEVASWLPKHLDQSELDRILADFDNKLVLDIRVAIEQYLGAAEEGSGVSARQQTRFANTETSTEDDDEEGLIDEEETVEEVDEDTPRRRAGKKNMLDLLLYRGLLPRYAFPTDVAAMHIFDRNKSSNGQIELKYSPSQGMPAALTQYAPGKHIWVDGKMWTSGALYSPMRSELFEAWRDRMIYFECARCSYAERLLFDETLLKTDRKCRACGHVGLIQHKWIRPPGFAHPVEVDPVTVSTDAPSKSLATRARLMAPIASDDVKWVAVGDHARYFANNEELLVTNAGPEGKGFVLCVGCGTIEPSVEVHKLGKPHNKPYPTKQGESACEGVHASTQVVLGTSFLTDVLVISTKLENEMTMMPGDLSTQIALRSAADAIAISGRRMLQLDEGEIMAEYRPSVNEFGPLGEEVEIFLYDTLDGGAGIAHRLGKSKEKLLQGAIELLRNCQGDCDSSCYRCLRSFKNRFEHAFLDRHVGLSFLEYSLSGKQPELPISRYQNAVKALADAIEEALSDQIETVETNTTVHDEVLGSLPAPILITTSKGRHIIDVSHPLTPDVPSNMGLIEAVEFGPHFVVNLVNELLINKALPRAIEHIQKKLLGGD
jgi:ATP-dependent helicase YprA (DUF1998 family)